MAASVLLNFANGVDFTPTDPLMGMVRAGAKLLSYDLLSVGRFRDMSTEEEKRGYIRKKVAQLRNMLENRSLSSEDQGERIRLIVTFDFKPWDFLKPDKIEATAEFDAAFPTLKLDFFKNLVKTVFGLKNPLLSRIDYIFLFVDDNQDEERSMCYRLTAYNGYSDTGRGENCLSFSSMYLNNERDKELEAINHLDANLDINDPAVKTVYLSFLEKQKNVVNHINAHLKKIGMDDVFSNEFKKTVDINTVEEFINFDYDGVLQNLIRNVAGLGADRFRDSTFFILNVRCSVASQKSKDEIALKSLVQLLCSMNDEQFHKQFRPLDNNDYHKLFVTSDPDDDDINRIALLKYSRDISALGVQVGGVNWWNPEQQLTGMNWDSSKEVEYYAYHPQNANAEGGHEDQNEIIDEIGTKKQQEFKEVRKVPFFFGMHPGDWQWYYEVTQAIDDCLTYEHNNNRPMVENLTRAADSELSKTIEVTNYAELGLQIEKFSVKDIQSKVDYETYIFNRKGIIEQLAKKAEDMRKELVKLGFRSRWILILFLSCIVFTLCYAYHFFYDESDEHPVWICAGFIAICLILAVGTFISQLTVKNKIRSIYGEIDNLFRDLKTLAKNHLKSVNELASEMNEADANRKTLSEMKAKFGEWNRHNKKVESWVDFARKMELLLENFLSYIKYNKSDYDQINGEVLWVVDDTILEGKPSVVSQIRSQGDYCDMKPQVEVVNQGKLNILDDVTCFISHFKFVCIQK